MSAYEVKRARGDQESAAIRDGLSSQDQSPWQWGHYVERRDGDEWTPLVYEADSLEDAEELHRRHRWDTGLTAPFRNSRVVRRAVSPWEVVE